MWKIKIENRKNYKGDGTYVGRPSALGNPFEIGKHGNREEVIDKYRDWLEDGLSGDNPAMRLFANLYDHLVLNGEITLICWCAPKPCHADVIKEVLLEIWQELEDEK